MDNYNDFSDEIYNWNIYTILNYIKTHYLQFMLLAFVVAIIYIVDHISNINAAIFGLPSSIPGINSTNSIQNLPVNKIKKIKKK